MHRLELAGIAGSDRSRAEGYASRYPIKTVFPDYGDLVESPDIDCVYISLTNELHTEWIIRSLKAGKHVLAEKPAGLDPEEFARVLPLTGTGSPVFLEGIMVRHHPWQETVRQMVLKQGLGKVREIRTRMSSRPEPGHSRDWRFDKKKGGGAFFDQGSYWVQFLQLLFGPLDNAECSGHSGFSGPNGIDLSFEATLQIPNAACAAFSASLEGPFEASHVIWMEKGEIRIPNFMRPYFGKQRMSMEVIRKGVNEPETTGFEPESYFVNQLNHFVRLMDGEQRTDDSRDSLQRISLMRKIYDSAIVCDRGSRAV
jgi:predicted dehydrogenase